jgi:hypothetical protein
MLKSEENFEVQTLLEKMESSPISNNNPNFIQSSLPQTPKEVSDSLNMNIEDLSSNAHITIADGLPDGLRDYPLPPTRYPSYGSSLDETTPNTPRESSDQLPITTSSSKYTGKFF